MTPKKYLGIFLILVGCSGEKESSSCQNDESDLFTLMSRSITNIDYSNDLEYTEAFNTYTYRNFYNGGGVAIGDINNDGLPDVFFCGNMVSNRLYLNLGDFRFKDITESSGLISDGVWSTGVSMADINGDGWLDIYVCKSGKPEGDKRHNELFINMGVKSGESVPEFKDMAKQYGVADYGHSTHAAFFDYDKDSDLDMYLLNNSLRSIGHYDLRKNQRTIRNPDGGNKLYRNDGDSFTDVSEEAGIYGSAIGFGLGVTISDVNKDGWQDIFVSNDFFERDYLYINNHDGTFHENLENIIGEISLGSMGADIGDINNDGLPEIFVTEMLPRDEERLKTKTVFEDWDKFQANQLAGYHKQFPRNVLQLNQLVPGDTQKIYMSEISRFAGVDATDWSWGALITDLDNDGYKDLFVANGIFKDLTDLDYINFYANPYTAQRLYEERGEFLKELIDKIPSNPLSNFAFKNNGDLTFEDASVEWGLSCPGFSNGSAYGDLDNDGDLDLVINNVNMRPFVYRNNSSEKRDNHFLSIQLNGLGKNTSAFGTQVTTYCGNDNYYQELAPMRGYQSSVDHRLHFGLGKHQLIDSIHFSWPDGTSSMLYDVESDQFLEVDQPISNEAVPKKGNVVSPTWFALSERGSEFSANSRKSSFVDFNRDPLLFHMVSAEGSDLSIGDINGDGLNDIFFGGSKGNSGEFYVQKKDQSFQNLNSATIRADEASHDSGSAFFDADGDGDLDLYVCSGGYEFPASSVSLTDRLYFNDGTGQFTKSSQFLPTLKYQNTSCVLPSDYDNDGDIDLFVGERSKPFEYGLTCDGYILQNNGKGVFENVTKEIAPELFELGMITDAVWIDYDGDNDDDLIVVGKWMPISLFRNDNGKFQRVESGFENSEGLWNCIEVADIDQNGSMDLVVGNHGLNSRFKASATKPMMMYVNDFDENGSIEQIITTYKGDKAYPFVGRDELVKRISSLKKKYLKYDDYKDQTVLDIFGQQLIDQSTVLKVATTQSMAFLNIDGEFVPKNLPAEAQFAPIYAIHIEDYDNDDIPDILMGGNFHWSKPKAGIYDAMKGGLLKGEGNGSFKFIGASQSGVHIPGEVRAIEKLGIGAEEDIYIFSRLNDYPLTMKKVTEIK